MRTVENNVSDNHTPGKELEQLDIFVGKWKVEEQTIKGSLVDALDAVRGIATYDWLAGKFYLITKWSNKFGDDSHIGIGVIGFDQSAGIFMANHYDNKGFACTYKVTVRRLTWVFTGKHERSTIEFTPDGNTFTEFREVSDDGILWKPLCRLRGSKLY